MALTPADDSKEEPTEGVQEDGGEEPLQGDPVEISQRDAGQSTGSK
jgi:hypothetical protein